jgi:hypothetical protein
VAQLRQLVCGVGVLTYGCLPAQWCCTRHGTAWHGPEGHGCGASHCAVRTNRCAESNVCRCTLSVGCNAARWRVARCAARCPLFNARCCGACCTAHESVASQSRIAITGRFERFDQPDRTLKSTPTVESMCAGSLFVGSENRSRNALLPTLCSNGPGPPHPNDYSRRRATLPHTQ